MKEESRAARRRRRRRRRPWRFRRRSRGEPNDVRSTSFSACNLLEIGVRDSVPQSVAKEPECRMKALAEDKGEYLNDAEYNKKSEKKKSMKTSAASTAGRNADLIPYQSDTMSLADAMDEFLAMVYIRRRESQRLNSCKRKRTIGRGNIAQVEVVSKRLEEVCTTR